MYRRSDKKNYIILIILLLFCVTFGYAVLNSTLNINGKSTIQKNTWDVHFENIQIKEGSVTATIDPAISNNTTISNFEITLDKPGDFYEFIVDVVNNGTIDAMISSIEKTPDLTAEQQKYLNYIIEYQNGEQITTKQLVKASEFVRLKVRVEYKKDITASDLPQNAETLNLGFTVNYVQSDGTGNNNIVMDNGVMKAKVLSGDMDTLGSEICIKDECFYVMYSDDTSVTMLAKYNLYIGDICTATTCTAIENPSGIQNSTAIGKILDESNKIIYPMVGITAFSDSITWNGVNGKLHPTYNEQSLLYKYIDDYSEYIKGLYIDVSDARIVNLEDYNKMGCTNAACTTAPSWFYSTSYWTGVGHFAQYPYNLVVSSANKTEISRFNLKNGYGVRPVIVIPKSEIGVDDNVSTN